MLNTPVRNWFRVSSDTVVKGATLVPSLVLAELFYKFHSFTVEFLAFAATWGALAFAVKAVSRLNWKTTFKP